MELLLEGTVLREHLQGWGTGPLQQCPPPASGTAAWPCDVSPRRRLACGAQSPLCIMLAATCYLKSKTEAGTPFLVGTCPFPRSFWVPLLHSPGWLAMVTKALGDLDGGKGWNLEKPRGPARSPPPPGSDPGCLPAHQPEDHGVHSFKASLLFCIQYRCPRSHMTDLLIWMFLLH